MKKKCRVSALTRTEMKFMELIWELEPINSTALMKECEKKFEWKKSTTYTMLRNLGEKELIKNENTIVTSVLKKEDYFGARGRDYVEEHFAGSLPMFLTAFCGSGVKLSEKDKEEIRRLLDEC